MYGSWRFPAKEQGICWIRVLFFRGFLQSWGLANQLSKLTPSIASVAGPTGSSFGLGFRGSSASSQRNDSPDGPDSKVSKVERKVSEYARWALSDETPAPTSAQTLLECWVGEFANAKSLCCDVSQGPLGRKECWDEVYTFHSCCLPSFPSVSTSTTSLSLETPDISRAIRQVKGRIFSLDSKLRAVEGSHRWSYLADTCLTGSALGYDFKLCLFGDARFGSLSFGSFDGWDGEHGLRYSSGQRCPGGPARSMKIQLVCGAKTEMLSIR